MENKENVLILENVAGNMSDSELKALYSKYGQINRVKRVGTNRQTVFIYFERECDACAARSKIAESNEITEPSVTRQNKTDSNTKSNGTAEKQNDFHELISTQTDPSPSSGYCEKCGKNAEYNCSRCSDFYCSTDCQLEDWNKHRRICFPVPPLQKAQSRHILSGCINNNSTSTPNQNSIEPEEQIETNFAPVQTQIPNRISVPRKAIENNATVVICCVVDHTSVYVRPFEGTDETAYINILKDIQDFAQTAQSIKGVPKYGDIVLVEFGGNYYRGVIFWACSSNTFTVKLIDFGTIINVGRPDMMELEEELKTRTQYIKKIDLKDAKEQKTNEEAVRYLLKLLDEETELILKYDTDTELVVKETGEALHQIVSNLHIAEDMLKSFSSDEGERESSDDVRIFFEAVEHKKVQGKNVRMTVLNNTSVHLGYIACIEFSEFKRLKKFDEDINNYCKGLLQSSYEPKLQEVCLARCPEDRRWHRAVCTNVFDYGKALMYFFDYGRIGKASFTDIHNLPMDLKFECCTAFCFIEGLGANVGTDKILELMNGVFRINKTIDFDNVKYMEEEQRCICSLPSVLDCL